MPIRDHDKQSQDSMKTPRRPGHLLVQIMQRSNVNGQRRTLANGETGSILAIHDPWMLRALCLFLGWPICVTSPTLDIDCL